MKNENIVTKKMIEQGQKIYAYYDGQNKLIEIHLNPEERFIKDFKDIQIDATIIEILPKDNTKVVGIHKGSNEIKIADNIIKQNFGFGRFYFSNNQLFQNYSENGSEINDNHFINNESNEVIQTKNLINNNKDLILGNNINNNEKNNFNVVENNSNINELNKLPLYMKLEKNEDSIKLFGIHLLIVLKMIVIY